MKKQAFLASIICFTMLSCETYKKIAQNDKSKAETTRETVTIKRMSDTLTIELPNIIYKDTIIEKINYQNKTLARVTYDSSGNGKVECLSGEILEIRETLNVMLQNDIQNNIEKEKSFKPQYFVYALIGLCLVLMVFMFMIQRSMNSIQKNLPSLVSEIIKGLN